MRPDLDDLLLGVLKHFDRLPRIEIAWVDLDEVDHKHFHEGHWWAACLYWKRPRYIGISPSLKRAPLYVLRYVVFHEVLHVALPPVRGVDHHRAFQVAERLWPDYLRANAWLDARSP